MRRRQNRCLLGGVLVSTVCVNVTQTLTAQPTSIISLMERSGAWVAKNDRSSDSGLFTTDGSDLVIDPGFTPSVAHRFSHAARVVYNGSQSKNEDSTMTKQDLQKEVLELHQFFEDWFTGRLANTDKNFRRFADVMADDFEIISPSGNRTARDALLQGLRHAHGSRKNAEKPFRIWIENIRVRNLERGLSLVTYEEWQETDTGTKGRLSTALFRQKSGAPNGAEWVHVHETWIGG